MLFGSLPADLFRAFSGRARWFYAGLLEYLNEAVFLEGLMLPRREVIEAIRIHVDRQKSELTWDGEHGDIDADLQQASDAGQKAHVAFQRLESTGWFVVHQDRYRRLVDLDSGARIVLEFLLELKSGRLRSYGGDVLQILTLLDDARSHPKDHSENLHRAAKSAKEFRNHLRSLGSALRTAEKLIVGKRDASAMIRTFITDFVSQHLIKDYKRLHTQTNPFRFRVRILELARKIEEDEFVLDALASSYAREGRALDLEQGRQNVLAELEQIIRVFSDLDPFLDVIEETNRRVEKRILNAVRYIDRLHETSSEAIQEVFTRLGTAPLPADAEIPVDAPCIGDAVAQSFQSLYKPTARRKPQTPTKIRRPQRDPAQVAYEQAIAAYRMRCEVTPELVAGYLEAALGASIQAFADELPLNNLDDFFVFERLRYLSFIDGGQLAQNYVVETAPGLFVNDWIQCPNFIIRRKIELCIVS